MAGAREDEGGSIIELKVAARGFRPSNGGGGGGGIPEFQAGGIVTEPTLALVGEVPEAIIPLADLPGIAAIQPAAPAAAGGEGGTRQPINLTVQIGEETFLTQIEDATRTGKIRVHERSIQKFGD